MLRLIKHRNQDPVKTSECFPDLKKMSCEISICPGGHVNFVFGKEHVIMSPKGFRDYLSIMLDVSKSLELMGFGPEEDS